MSPLLFIVVFVCVIMLCVALTSYFVANAVKSSPTPVPVGDGLECTFTHTLIPEAGYTSKLYIENDDSGVEINWGDGTIETVVPTPFGAGGIISHTYAGTGPYTCTLKGATVFTLQFAKQNQETEEPIANIAVNSLNFTKAQNLRNLQAVFVFENSSIDISQCRRLTDLNLAGNSDVNTGITSLDLSNFTKLVNCTITDFINLASLTGVSGLTSLTMLDVSNCTSLDTLNVSGCTSLTTLDVTGLEALASLDTSGCTSLATLTLSNLEALASLDTSGCTSLTMLDVSNCTSLTSLNCSGCTVLSQFDATGIVQQLVSNNANGGTLSFQGTSITNPGVPPWSILTSPPRNWTILTGS